MQNKEKYFIVDECGRYVVGYVTDNNDTRYIAYDKSESFAVRPFINRDMAQEYIQHLRRISQELKDNHIFQLDTL